ncbi:MAG: hypothetical protein GWP14_10335 [Actinobacteria bacterium]|nr:hypothetical protein [Actinomycetota bacterium]
MGTKLTTSMTSVVFSELPVHETIWSITTGADGKIYAGICGELTGGLSVFLVRYNPDTARYEYLLEVGPALNDPANNGRAPQSKIHYSLIPASTGELYCATHCSGPPLEQRIWRPWHTWDDPERMFSGFHIFRYDPATGDMNDFGVMHPNEGCRAMALAEKRQKLYGVTWPRDHFFVFDIKERRYQDLGRIGDINPQSIWIDAEENGYTIDDLGQMVKYCADEQRLMHLDVRIPSEPGLPCSVYDTVPAPDGRGVYGVTWNMEKTHSPDRLFRYDPAEGTEGKIYDPDL